MRALSDPESRKWKAVEETASRVSGNVENFNRRNVSRTMTTPPLAGDWKRVDSTLSGVAMRPFKASNFID